MLSFEYQQFLNEKVLEHLHNYVRVGDKLNFRCPLCGDSRKSSTKKRGWWYMKSSSFFCFNCSTGMSGIKFLQAISGSSYEDIRKEYTKLFLKSGLSTSLSASFVIPASEPSVFDIKPIVKAEWKKPLSEEAKTYLDSRLVTKSPFYNDSFYLWTNKRGNDYILIDWVLNGVDAYFQLNDFKKHGSMKYIFPKDSKKLIYGLDNVDMSWPYIIVFEGVYDSIFVKNGIAVGTKAITDYQLKLIKERFPHHQIVISFDNDISGLSSMQKLVESKEDFKFFKWFNSNTKQKDINDYVIFKNNVNIFSDKALLEKLIVGKLSMKMYLLRNGFWNEDKKAVANDSSSSKARKISKCFNW